MAHIVSSTSVDVEAANIAYLAGVLPPGVVVATRVPRSSRGEEAFPALMVRVTRTGGQRWSVAHDGPTILVECWAATSTAAWDLAGTARDALISLDNTRIGDVWLSYRAEAGGPVNYPDPRTTHHRYQFLHEQTARVAG